MIPTSSASDWSVPADPRRLRAIMPESEGLENYVVNDLFDEMLDTIVQGLCFEVHRAHKNGRLFLDEGPQVRRKAA